jgi:hypothetical protein
VAGVVPRTLSKMQFHFSPWQYSAPSKLAKSSQLCYCAIATESEAICCEKDWTCTADRPSARSKHFQYSSRTWCPNFEDGDSVGEEGNMELNKERDREVWSNLVIMTYLQIFQTQASMWNNMLLTM